MPKRVEPLSPVAVARLSEPGMHAVGGVPGLHLQVTPAGARSWVLRVMVAGKRREVGLGGFGAVTLAKARDAAREAREKIAAGVDPVEERRAARSAAQAERLKAATFEDCASDYIKAHAAAWKNAKHGQQWRNTLETYAFPVMGSMLVRDVELPHVLAVLEPIWREKTETASRLRNRIELVLDWATARGHREGLNPARWRGHLDKLLPKPGKVAKGENHPALPASEAGTFMAHLRQQEGMGARALEFAILTATRSGKVRGATWREIDLQAGVWTIPANRMKAGKEHRVPLSVAALALLSELPRMAGTNFVFPAPRSGAELSNMAMTVLMRRMHAAELKAGRRGYMDPKHGKPAVPHGFRSTFRDWVSERTSYPGDLAEMALAHAIGNAVEAAYRRGDMFKKRRRLMQDWAEFCASIEPAGAQVVPIRAAQG